MFFNIKNFYKFYLDKTGSSDFSTIYMILVIAIVAVVLLAVVKPLFQDSVSKKVIAN